MRKIHKRLLMHQPYKALFASIPNISTSERRWAFFQILSALIFFFVALAIGVLTVDMSTVTRGNMLIAWVLFGLGALALFYALGLGIHWFQPKLPTGEDDKEAKRVERDDRLHEDIQALIKEMRQDRSERRKSN